MSRLSGVMRTAFIALLALTIAAAASAQITRGGLVGTVRDASGAVVPGVTVTVTNMDTNAVRTTASDEQGAYRVPALEPGRYKITTDLSGFAPFEQTGIAVRSALETSVDITIRAGGISEAVTVTADASAVTLNRTNPTIGTTINARAVEELPLPGGRNINNLILTVPNASATTGQGTFAVNGNRPRNNNYMVDGSDNNDISVTISTSAIVPEAVQEFQVLQNPYSAEFGRNSGGQINVVTKSGSNMFRGDVWDFYQASGLNSRNNLEKASNLPTQPKNIRHQAGGTSAARSTATGCSSTATSSATRSTRRCARAARRSASPRRRASPHSRPFPSAQGSRRPAARRCLGSSGSSRTCMR